jgi:Protein of unknown function (DUF1176)
MPFARRPVAARRLLAIGLISSVALAGGPASAQIKEFRDWLAACDNLRTCTAYGFDADMGGYAYVRLTRDGGADAPLRVTIAVNVQEGAKFKVSFDDPALGGLPAEATAGESNADDDLKRLVISDPKAMETLLASLRKANKLIVTRIDAPGATASDPAVTEISLNGVVAAMLWIDDQQKRIDTVTALVKRGSKPATAVPPPPTPPVVTAAKIPPGPKADKAPAAVIAKARAVCEDKTIDESEDATRLAADQVMYWFPCRDKSGAYNFLYALIIDQRGRPLREVEFKLPREVAATADGGVEMNMNPGFDESTQTMSLFNKGRGIADCGQSSDWAWDGRGFRLIQSKQMPTCKGVAPNDWAVLYRAERK